METETSDTFETAGFRPQESLSMGAQLHRILRAAIIRGDLMPGQAISEVEMSKRFAISRQPVREAFIKLGEERLIEVLPQRGTYVRKISVKEVLDARHLREIIEVSIVREVAQRHDDALIKTLRELIVRQGKVRHGDSQSFLALDEEMHKAIALHAGREYAWRITEGIKAQMNRVRFMSFDFATPTPQLVAEHVEIVDAIEAGDADLAGQRMEGHLRGILSSLPLIAERYPDRFVEE
jgi:DNA-binding GntR family transcriptional regulator